MKNKSQKRGPFILLGSREIYKNPWIRVREDRVIRPDGKRGIFGIITQQAGVQVVPIDRYGNVYLTREYHYGIAKTNIEVAAGGIDKGERPLDAAKRELLEETGLAALKWISLGTVDPLTTIMHSPQYIFLALGAHKIQGPAEEEKKTIKILKIPLYQAVKMAIDNRINCALTITSVLRVDHYLRKKNHVFKKSGY